MGGISKVFCVTHKHWKRSCTGGSGNITASIKTFYPVLNLRQQTQVEDDGLRRNEEGRGRQSA